jgi:hypothetical protein
VDPRTFDTFVKVLSQRRSRRRVVASALSGALFTLAHLADTAQGKRRGDRRKKRGAKRDKKRREQKQDRRQNQGKASHESCIALGNRCRKHGEPCCDGARCRTLLGLPLLPGRCRCPEGTRACGGACIALDACCEADGTGTCPPCDVCASGCPFTSVQAAIDAAAPGETISICAGTYTETLTIDKDLTLRGAGDGDGSGDSILRGPGTGSVVTISAGQTVALEHLRITGGDSDDGGGIFSLDANLTLSDCTVTGNTARFGGGIESVRGTLTLNESTVNGNASIQGGGGLFVDGANTTTLNNSTVSDNTAGHEGGGIATDDDEVTLMLTNSTVRGNISALGGGGIFNAGNATLTNSTVSDNRANDTGGGLHGDGGGIFNAIFGTLTLESSSVTNNHAETNGGGIANSRTVACSDDSTVSGNTAGTPGTENCFDDLAFGGDGCATCPA